MKRWMAIALLAGAAAGLLPAQERSLDTYLDGLAASAREVIEKSGAKAVAVVELGTPQGGTGGDVGVLGKYVAAGLQSRLAAAGGRGFQVVDRLNLERVLKEQELQLSGLVAEGAGVRVGRVLACDSLLTGSLENLKSLVLVNLNLLGVERGEVLGSAQKRIPLGTEVKALLGIDVEDAPLVKAITPAGTDFPYYLRVKGAEGAKREYYLDGRRYVLALPGETYTLEIENRTGKAVGVALFVDGLNTAFMKRELPRAAVKWIVYPRQTATIPGWQVDGGTARRFVFAGREESLAARQGFADEVGLITAAFFSEQESLTRGEQQAGTKAGEAFGAPVESVEVRLESSPAVVFNVWYDYARGLAERGVRLE